MSGARLDSSYPPSWLRSLDPANWTQGAPPLEGGPALGSWRQDLVLPCLLGLLSHLVVLATIYFTAKAGNHIWGSNEVVKPGWGLLANWDGGWYRLIAEHGYEYASDSRQHSVAFFPLFPLLVRPLLRCGLPFGLAGALVNGVAFWGALPLLHRWTRQFAGLSAARWAVAALALCPLALFGSVAYSEGLFILVTTASLYLAWRGRFWAAGTLGILAAATRLLGILLVPALLVEARRRGLGWRGYFAGLLPSLGLFSYLLLLGIKFQDPLAFFHAEAAWRQPGIDIAGWFHALTYGMVSEGMLNPTIVLGGIWLLWRFRTRLPAIAASYAWLSLLVVLFSGTVGSDSRYVWGIFTVSMAAGMFLAQRPRWAWAIMAYSTVLLAIVARNYALSSWVA